MAETLITLAILGIVAAISIPALVKSQTEKANRTKIRKAMAVYEKLINQVVIENDIHTTSELGNFMCEDIEPRTEFLNYVKYTSSQETKFHGKAYKTADGVWWNFCQPVYYNARSYHVTVVALNEHDIAAAYGDDDLYFKIAYANLSNEPIFVFEEKFINNGLHINDEVAFTYESNKERLYNYINGNLKVDYQKYRNFDLGTSSTDTPDTPDVYNTTCSSGWYWDSYGNSCVYPGDTPDSGGGGSDHNCGSGYYWNGNSCVYSGGGVSPDCDSGYYWNGNTCVSSGGGGGGGGSSNYVCSSFWVSDGESGYWSTDCWYE